MTNVELEVLIALLKLTKDGPADCSLVGKTARAASEVTERILERLSDASLIKKHGSVLGSSTEERVRLGVYALEMGADFERVCRYLGWREFESIVTRTFEEYNYRVFKNLRFKESDGKNWEIDVLACKSPRVISVDCKQWRKNWTKTPIVRIVEKHVERTRALTEQLPHLKKKLNINEWRYATVFPLILSLFPSPFKFHSKTPLVPALRLQSFLNELPAYTHSLTHFTKYLELSSSDSI
jgi:Holliday junction resolvase-like predicted endonuclease